MGGGEEHLAVVSSYNNLATAYRNLRGQVNVAKVIGYYEQALAIQRKQLGEEHQDVASSYSNMVNAYSDLGEQANMMKIVEYAEQALKLFIRQLGKQHPYISKSYDDLVRAYHAIDIQRAQNFFKERCFFITEIQAYAAKEYGKDDPNAKALAEILETHCKIEENPRMKM